MTTKILTMRVPSPLYASLCTTAAESGLAVSAHVRQLIEREHQAEQVALLRNELLAKLEGLTVNALSSHQPSPLVEEIVLLCRATAAHLNPQLVTQVHAKLAGQQREAIK